MFVWMYTWFNYEFNIPEFKKCIRSIVGKMHEWLMCIPCSTHGFKPPSPVMRWLSLCKCVCVLWALAWTVVLLSKCDASKGSVPTQLFNESPSFGSHIWLLYMMYCDGFPVFYWNASTVDYASRKFVLHTAVCKKGTLILPRDTSLSDRCIGVCFSSVCLG